MKWARWSAGKWHRVAPAPKPVIKQMGEGAVETLCGIYKREPDRTTESPERDRCPRCVHVVATGRAAA